MPFTQQAMVWFFGYLSHLVTVQKTNLSPSLWNSVDHFWTSPQACPTKLFMKLDRSYFTILSCCSIQKPFRWCRTVWKKISQTKLASSKATITSHWNKACKMKLSGLLGTQSYYWYISCDTEVDPNKAAWWWLCMEQQLRHCRQRTRSSQADWSRTASPTSAHCRHPDQRYCQEYFYKRTW